MADNAPAKVDPAEEFKRVMRKITNEIETSGGDDDQLTSWIQGKLAAILSADDFNAINAIVEQGTLTASQDLVGRTFEIRDFALRKSTIQGPKEGVGSQMNSFAIIDAVDVSSGEPILIDGGGDQFVAQMVRMRDLYGFPYVGTIIGRVTGSGNTLLSWRFFDPKRPKIQ